MNWKVFLLIFLLPSLVLAQTPPYLPSAPQLKLDPVPPGEDVIIALPKEGKAPFDGQLFNNSTALRWGNYLEQYRLRLQVCYQQQQEFTDINQSYFTKVLKIEQEANTRIVSDLEFRLRRTEEKNAKLEGELSQGPAWYNSLSFGIVLGVVGTASLVALGAWALSSAGR